MTTELSAPIQIEPDLFTVRRGDVMHVTEDEPVGLPGHILAVMFRSMPDPPGRLLERTKHGPVWKAAVIAAQRAGDVFEWVQLSPPTKEGVGTLMEQAGCELDTWYWLRLAPADTTNGTND